MAESGNAQGTGESLDTALKEAVRNAVGATPGADRLIEWKLLDITGKEGGIARLHEVTVTIGFNSG